VRRFDIDILWLWWWWYEDGGIVTRTVVERLSTVCMDIFIVVVAWTRECGLHTRSTRSDHVGHVTDVGSGGDPEDGLDVNVNGLGSVGVVMNGGSGGVTVLEQGIPDLKFGSVFALAQAVVQATLFTIFFLHRWRRTSLARRSCSSLHL
jgi:hypothetical protein